MSIFIQSYANIKLHVSTLLDTIIHKACNSAGLKIVYPCSLRVHLLHLIFIVSFKLGHVSIPKRRIFLLLFLFCAYDSSVLQNFKISTHLLPIFSYKDPRQTEVTYHCINFNDRVRKVPKIYYLNVWNVLKKICNFDFFFEFYDFEILWNFLTYWLAKNNFCAIKTILHSRAT